MVEVSWMGTRKGKKSKKTLDKARKALVGV